MKTALKETVFEHSQTEDSNVFSIKADGKAFRILIDGIYSDKITSCVRELSTNAFDSHAVAKNRKPFYVHLPTELRPEFYVRDYGVGMDHNKVMNTYSRMFDSDKTGDNTQAGMFGLGSKTPFAYTDQFHITCYDGGTSRLYMAGIGKNGVPEIHLFSTESCEELPGVKVGFAVQAKDFSEFRKAAGKIRLGFPSPFESNTTFPEDLGTPFLSGKNWTAYKGSTARNIFGGCYWYARQGCVLYPITSHNGLNIPNDSYNRFYIIDCPIGTLEVTTARESLAYTQKVVDYLNKRFDQIRTEASDIVWNEVKDVENVATFFKKIDDIRPNFVSNAYTHPVTGLNSAVFHVVNPSSRYKVTKQPDGRWNYDDNRDFACETLSNNPPAYGQPKHRNVYEIEDISAFLDVTRDAATTSFSHPEARRIARYTRLWMEANALDTAEFYLGVKRSDEFWKAVLPNVTRVPLTTAEIMKLVPTRKDAPKPLPYIRGLALSFKGGEQTVVEQINPLLNAAWVPADLYRTKAEEITALAKKFKVNNIYIATVSVVKKVVEAKIPTLAEHIAGTLKTEYDGMTWETFVDYVRCQRNYNYRSEHMIKFLEKLWKADKALYKKFGRMKTPFAPLVTNIEPIFQWKLAEIKEVEYKGILALIADSPVKESPEVKEIIKTISIIDKNDYNPGMRFLNDLTYINNDQYPEAVEAITTMLRLFPLK